MFCQRLNDIVAWIDLGKGALKNLEVDFGRF
jgi:hypothetical protein